MIASQNGHIEIVKLLLDKGADINLQNSNDETALILAHKNGHTEIVTLLLNKETKIMHNFSLILLSIISSSTPSSKDMDILFELINNISDKKELLDFLKNYYIKIKIIDFNNIKILYLLDIYQHIIKHKLFKRDVISMEVPKCYTSTGDELYLFYSHNIDDIHVINDLIDISYDTYLSNHYLNNLGEPIEYFPKEIRDKAKQILEEYNNSKKEENNKIRKMYETRDYERNKQKKDTRDDEIETCVICGDENDLQDYIGKIGQKYKICKDCVKHDLKNINLDGKRKFLRKSKRKSPRKSKRKS
jgi:hypothetical protein